MRLQEMKIFLHHLLFFTLAAIVLHILWAVAIGMLFLIIS